MGKGDKKSKRGKIILGSHGVSRPKKRNVVKVETTGKDTKKAKDTAKEKTAAKPKKPAAKKAEKKTEE